MAKKKAELIPDDPNLCFVKELAGENPPTLSEMDDLYQLAAGLFSLRPWEMLDESQLILAPHPEGNKLCYCSVMGAMGEVFSMHAYIGEEGYRSFVRVASGELTDPAEYLASLN